MITCKNNFGEIVHQPKEKFVFRPSVYGFIRNEDRICVFRTKSNDKIWFPGGGIEAGETRQEALLREIDEETGLKNVKIGRLLGSFENFFYYQPRNEAMQAFLFFYECFSLDTALKTNSEILDDEAQDLLWLPIRDITADDIADLPIELFDLLQSL